MRQLDGLVVIATPAHTQAIARHLAEEAASNGVAQADLSPIVSAHSHLLGEHKTLLSSAGAGKSLALA